MDLNMRKERRLNKGRRLKKGKRMRKIQRTQKSLLKPLLFIGGRRTKKMKSRLK